MSAPCHRSLVLGEEKICTRPDRPLRQPGRMYNVEPSKVDARVAYTANAGRREGDIE